MSRTWDSSTRVEIILNPLEENFPFPELPPADFSDLPLTRYLLNKRPLCFIMSSRGCPHQCAFCSVHTTFANGYQRRPAESVFREIESRYAQGYRVFDFEDDNLSFQRDAFERLLELLIQPI